MITHTFKQHKWTDYEDYISFEKGWDRIHPGWQGFMKTMDSSAR